MTKWLNLFYLLFFVIGTAGAFTIEGSVSRIVAEDSIGFADYWITNDFNETRLITLNMEVPNSIVTQLTPSNFYLEPGQTKKFNIAVNSNQQTTFETITIKALNCNNKGSCIQAQRTIDITNMKASTGTGYQKLEQGIQASFQKTKQVTKMEVKNLEWLNGLLSATIQVINYGQTGTFQLYLIDGTKKTKIGEAILENKEITQIQINNYNPITRNLTIESGTGEQLTIINNQKKTSTPVNNIQKTSNSTNTVEAKEPTTAGLFLAGETTINYTILAIILLLIAGGIMLIGGSNLNKTKI